MADEAPWEKYGKADSEHAGPWEKYGGKKDEKPKPKAGLKGDPGMGSSPEAGFLNRMAEGVTGLWNLGKSVVAPRPDLPQVPGVPTPVVDLRQVGSWGNYGFS